MASLHQLLEEKLSEVVGVVRPLWTIDTDPLGVFFATKCSREVEAPDGAGSWPWHLRLAVVQPILHRPERRANVSGHLNVTIPDTKIGDIAGRTAIGQIAVGDDGSGVDSRMGVASMRVSACDAVTNWRALVCVLCRRSSLNLPSNRLRASRNRSARSHLHLAEPLRWHRRPHPFPTGRDRGRYGPGPRHEDRS